MDINKSSRNPTKHNQRQFSIDLERLHFVIEIAAMDELFRSNMTIILKGTSCSVQTPGIDINDLVQTAAEGLLIAINRWSFAKSDVNSKRYNKEFIMERSKAVE